MMKSAARIVGIFLLQVVTLLIATRLIGAPIMSATVWRVPLGSCYGYDIDFRFMIGLSAASVLVAVVFDLKRSRQSTVWTFIAALVTLDILYSAHLKFPSPCF
jgi:hypothetical protein